VLRFSCAAAMALTLLTALACAQPPPAAREWPIGYPSVAAALAAVRAKPGVKISLQSGWTVIDDRDASTFWSFTPPGHPAHPAAVRRILTEKDGAFYLQTRILCQATKSACDKLKADFDDLENKMRERIERDRRR
jgi:hypothetical protein